MAKPEKYFLSTLTPLFIGASENSVLSPYSDYVFDPNNKIIHYIDQKKLFSRIPTDKIDAIVNKIYHSAGTNRNFEKYTLDQLIADENIDVNEISSGTVECEVDPKSNQIYQFISSGKSIYIPGSSIKGAIRTAFCYDYFKNDSNGKKLIEEFEAAIKSIESRYYKLEWSTIDKLDKELAHAKNLKERKSIERQINKTLKPLINKIDDTLSMIKSQPFGTNPRQDFSKFFQVSDTEKINKKDSLFIDNIKRIKKKEDTDLMDIFSEVALMDNPFSFFMKLNKIHGEIQNYHYFNQFNHLDDIFKIINQFTTDYIQYSLNTLPSDGKFSQVQDDLEGLLERIDDNEIITRIGGHKSFFYNTIMMLLPEETFEVFRRVLRIGKNPKTKQLVKENFPTSQAFLVEGDTNIETGWCKIEKA
jgi:CRISPR type III-A-associated RAMP protein Csm5